MKVVEPSRLLAEAAEVLWPVATDVVIIGATALEVALSGSSAAISPTRDVDGVVDVGRAAAVIEHLEAAEMKRSEVPHERSFTWVRGDLKVQLVRGFHPFPKPPAAGLPGNPRVTMASAPEHQVDVAFSDDPESRRLVCANAACLLALKKAAFGRTRPPGGAIVERDFHDAFLLAHEASDSIISEVRVASYDVRAGVRDALTDLASGQEATQAAARQMVALGAAGTQRSAEANVRRAAIQLQHELEGQLPSRAPLDGPAARS